MKTDKLIHQFNELIVNYKFAKDIEKTRDCADKLWKWIEENYISKDKVERLKIELNKISSDSANYFCDVVAVKEINQKIENILK